MSRITPISGNELGASAKSESVDLIKQTIDEVASVVLGKEQQIKMAVCCLLARGHLLIEDLPGMGKTTLSHSLGKVLGLSYQRVQFTSDMLPSDIIGASIYDKRSGDFRFVKGPLFTQLLLADEVNRTTPKTQSALLEAMEEGQVSVDGNTYTLPEPFFVIATQNPSGQSGTYPLPESQLDRFLMRIELGYPDAEAELAMLKNSRANRQQDNMVSQRMDISQLFDCQAQVDQVKASDVLLDYLQRLINYSRTSPDFTCGISPRGSLALLQAAKAWAFIEKRNHVIPEDVQSVLPWVTSHRLASSSSSFKQAKALAAQIIDAVDVL